jgi:hypothetical protein
MPSFQKVAIAVGILGAVVCCVGVKVGDSEGDARSEIDAFNKKFVELHLKMDTPGIMALWAEDGVDLMQGEAPMVGRKTITTWIEGLLANMPRYKVTKEEMEFHDIQVCRDWATEWPRSIRWRKRRKGSRISADTGRWRWCCTGKRAADGKLSRKCGIHRRSLETSRDYAANLERYSSSKCQRVTASAKFSACSSCANTTRGWTRKTQPSEAIRRGSTSPPYF